MIDGLVFWKINYYSRSIKLITTVANVDRIILQCDMCIYSSRQFTVWPVVVFFHVELLLHYSFLCITQFRYDYLFLLLFAFGALISGRRQFICIHLKPAGNQYLEYKSLKIMRDRASYKLWFTTKQRRNEYSVPGIFSQNW